MPVGFWGSCAHCYTTYVIQKLQLQNFQRKTSRRLELPNESLQFVRPLASVGYWASTTGVPAIFERPVRTDRIIFIDLCNL